MNLAEQSFEPRRQYPKLKFNLSKAKLEKEIFSHSHFVTSICLLKDNRLASASCDKVIHISDINTFEVKIILRGHKGGIYHVTQLLNGYLMSSSADKTIKLWEINKRFYQCIKTIKGHSHWVFKGIELSNSFLATCSHDHTIKIWKGSHPYNCLKTLKEHEDSVYSILELKNKKILVSSGSDWKICFRKLKSFKCQKIISGIECCWSSGNLSELINGRIIVGGYDVLSIINVSSYQIESTISLDLNNIIGSINLMTNLFDGTILCGCEKGQIIQIEIYEFKTLKIMNSAHLGDIYGIILLEDGRLITCSADNSIKVWI